MSQRVFLEGSEKTAEFQDSPTSEAYAADAAFLKTEILDNVFGHCLFKWMKIMTTRQHLLFEKDCLPPTKLERSNVSEYQHDGSDVITLVMQLTVILWRETHSHSLLHRQLNMTFFTSWDLVYLRLPGYFVFPTPLSFLNTQAHLIAKEEATPPFIVPHIINGCCY